MNTSNFDIDQVCNITKRLNNDRRYAQIYCYKIRVAYNAVRPEEHWDGQSRINFHKKMFGDDSNTGVIGELLNVCSAMNEILYNFAIYVSNVYNAQNFGDRMYTFKDFIDDSVTFSKWKISPLDQWKLNPKKVIVSDFVITYLSRLKVLLNQFKEKIEDFNLGLNELRENAIFDNSVQLINQQIQILNEKVLDAEQIVNNSINETERFIQIANNEVNKTVDAQTVVYSKIKGMTDGDAIYFEKLVTSNTI